MAALPRILQRIFGSTGAAAQFGQIGSEAAGAATTTKDLVVIQSLAQYLSGLYAITANLNEPPRGQDLNGLYLLITSQLAYLMQAGIPEYEAGTNYYADKSICQSAGIIYKCILGSDATPNINHIPASSPTYWAPFAEAADILTKLKTVDGPGSGLDADTVSGFGIGTFSKIITIDADAVNTLKNGKYYVSAGTNFPGGQSGHLDVYNITADYGAFKYVPEILDSMTYERTRRAGAYTAWAKAWNSSNDGPGSGLDADTVSGFGIGMLNPVNMTSNYNNYVKTGIYGDNLGTMTNGPFNPYGCGVFVISYGAGETIQLAYETVSKNTKIRFQSVNVWSAWGNVWSSFNDGTGSGLDADLLDGQEGAYYRDALTALRTPNTYGSGIPGVNSDGSSVGRFYYDTATGFLYMCVRTAAGDNGTWIKIN